MSDSSLIVDKIKISEQFVQHKNILYKLLQNSQKKKTETHYLQGEIDAMFTRLYEMLSLTSVDPSLFAYNVKVPNIYKNLIFDVFIQYDQSESSSNLQDNPILIQLVLGGQKIEKKLSSISQKLQELGTVSFNRPGTIPFFVTIPKQRADIRDGSWSSSGYSYKVGDIDSLLLLNTQGDNSGGLIRQIMNWAPKKQFLITFDYNTHGENVIFRVFDKLSVNEDGSDTRQHVYSDHSLSANDWSPHQLIVSSDAKSTAGYMQFLNNSKKIQTRIDIRNLSVVEINYPQIFFVKKTNTQKTEESVPSIKFTKINPTKYRLDVSGAYSPYVLLFLEAYNSQWRLRDITRDSLMMHAKIMHGIGRIFTILLPFISPDSRDEDYTAAQYFDGTVSEGKHSNSFLDKSIFSPWGKVAIARNSHLRANGYANAWIIKPEDMLNRSSYTLILEMSLQNYFYLYLGISIFIFFSVLAYGIVLLFRKQK